LSCANTLSQFIETGFGGSQLCFTFICATLIALFKGLSNRLLVSGLGNFLLLPLLLGKLFLGALLLRIAVGSRGIL
jgi:hypothetical protein